MTPEEQIAAFQAQLQDVTARLDQIESERVGFYEIPALDVDPIIPLATEVGIIQATQAAQRTDLVVGWSNPDPLYIDHFELWATNLVGGSAQPYLVASVTDSPAAFSVHSDDDTNVSIAIRTFTKDGLSSGPDSSPTVATAIVRTLLTAAEIAAGSIGDSLLDRSTDPIVVTNADVSDLAAGKITTGSLAADVAILGTVLAAQIQAGTISSVNISAGTYSLVSGSETMTIDGTNGFRQVSTGAAANTTTIHNGKLEVSDGGTNRTRLFPTFLQFGNDAFTDIYVHIRKDSTDGGYIELKNNSDVYGTVLQAEAGGGGTLTCYSGASTTSTGRPAVRITGEATNLGKTDSGYVAVNNSSSANKVELGVDGGDNGYISVTNDTGSESVIIGSDANLGQADSGYVAVNNAAGTVKAEMGVQSGGNDGKVVASGTAAVDVLAWIDSTHYSLSRASSTAALNGLYVNGNQVISAQQSTVTKPTGGATVDGEARTAVDAIIDVLEAHGIMA